MVQVQAVVLHFLVVWELSNVFNSFFVSFNIEYQINPPVLVQQAPWLNVPTPQPVEPEVIVEPVIEPEVPVEPPVEG